MVHRIGPRLMLKGRSGKRREKWSIWCENWTRFRFPPSATVKEACQCMRNRRVGAVLVTDGDRRLVGIFTGRDAVGRVLADGKDADRTRIGEVMTRDPHSVSPERSAIDALRMMFDIGCRHIPIVENGCVVGV